MKKLLLVCLALLCLQGICFAKIEKQVDDFDGSYAYYVDVDLWENHARTYINTTFNLCFSDNYSIGSPNLILRFRQDDVYAIDPTIKMKIDNNIYTWTSPLTSNRSNGYTELLINIPSNVFQAIPLTKKDIEINFTYHSLDGHYKKDYVIPFKTIKEVQTMYEKYYKNIKPETTLQAAK